MIGQIFWGSLILFLCTFVHLAIIFGWARALQALHIGMRKRLKLTHQVILIGFTLATIIFAHAVQVWIWAVALRLNGALSNYNDAIYFSLVTYTTVGYGDLTIGPDHRIFGAMAAVTGLLAFGISTALLVGLLSRMYPPPED